MKLFYTILFSTVLCIASFAQNIAIQWNFNQESLTPNIGEGSITMVGSAQQTYASGGASGGSSDPDTVSNRAMNTNTYPDQGTGAKTTGVQFNFNTDGYSAVAFTFDVRMSNTAANQLVFMYAADGVSNWQEVGTFTMDSGSVWRQPTVDLSSIPEASNNANGAIRVVTDFAPGTSEYAAAKETSSYGSGGTIRFDMVTVTGEVETSISEQMNSVSPIATIKNLGNTFEITPNTALENIELIALSGKTLQSISNTGLEIITLETPHQGIFLIRTKSEGAYYIQKVAN